MDWATIAGQLVRIGAPVLGSLIGGPIGGIAANVIAAALGTDATPEAVGKALEDPAAVEKVKFAEAQSGNQLAQLQAELADAQNARATMLAAPSGIGYTPVVLTYAILAIFAMTLGALFFVRVDIPQSLFQLLNIMLGAELAALTQSVNFWFGTTKSSHDNGAAVRSLAGANVSPMRFQAANSNAATLKAA